MFVFRVLYYEKISISTLHITFQGDDNKDNLKEHKKYQYLNFMLRLQEFAIPSR